MGFDVFVILMLTSSCRHAIAQTAGEGGYDQPPPYAYLTVTAFDIVGGSNVVYSVRQPSAITFDLHVSASVATDAILIKVEVYLTDYDVSGCHGRCYTKHVTRASKPPVGTELQLSPSSTHIIEDVTATVHIDTTDELVSCEDIKLVCASIIYKDGEYSAGHHSVCNHLSDGAVDCSHKGGQDTGSPFITLTVAGLVVNYSLTI